MRRSLRVTRFPALESGERRLPRLETAAGRDPDGAPARVVDHAHEQELVVVREQHGPHGQALLGAHCGYRNSACASCLR